MSRRIGVQSLDPPSLPPCWNPASCARLVWNWGLALHTETYAETQQALSYPETTKALTQLKQRADKPFLNEASSVVLQQSLRNLAAAFDNFFHHRAHYPRCKSRKAKQSVRYQANAFTLRDQQLTLAKQDEPLQISWSRPLPENAKLISLTISKDQADRYFVSLLVETELRPLPVVAADVGIDLGIKMLATCSNGEKLENPRPLQRATKSLRRAQRRLSRKVKGSCNREKQRLKVAKQHARIRDLRSNHLHQFTTKIIRENQAIYVEGLNVAGMLRNHRLARHLSDAAFGEILRQHEYKAQWHGREYYQLDQYYPSSKLCSQCGHLLFKLALSVRGWQCPGCDTEHERDENAATVILLAGRKMRATGSDAREVNAYERRAVKGHSA